MLCSTVYLMVYNHTFLCCFIATYLPFFHDDVIKWKHFPRHCPFVRGIHLSPVNSPHTGQWRGALMLSLICVWINGWVNNREARDLRRHRAHYDVTVVLHRVALRTLVDASLIQWRHVSAKMYQITGNSIAYSTACSRPQRTYLSSALLALWEGNQSINGCFPDKETEIQKAFLRQDVI